MSDTLNEPTFSESFRQHADAIAKRARFLEQSSADIKSLQAFLEKTNFRETVALRFKEEASSLSTQADLELGGWAETQTFVSSLVWARYGNKGDWRLQLRVESQKCHFDDACGADYEEWVQETTTPLLECPVDQRLEAARYLPKFLEVMPQVELGMRKSG